MLRMKMETRNRIKSKIDLDAEDGKSKREKHVIE